MAIYSLPSDLPALRRPLSLIGLCTRLRGGETSCSEPKFASKSADRSSRARAGPYIRWRTWVEVDRYAGLGRGLTAPSRAASYHGPMPTLSTCPSWNKDGRGGCSGASAELFSWGSKRVCIHWYIPRVHGGIGKGVVPAASSIVGLDEM